VAQLLDQIDPVLEYLFLRINPRYPALRSDVARLALLHAHGGIYHDESIAPADLAGFHKVGNELKTADAVFQLQGPARGPNRGTWRAVNTDIAVSRRLSSVTHGLLRVIKCRLLQQLRLVEMGSAHADQSSKNLFWAGSQTVVDFVQQMYTDVQWEEDRDLDGSNRTAPYVRAKALRGNESFSAFFWPFQRTGEILEYSKRHGSDGQHWSVVKDELLFLPRHKDEPLPPLLGSVDTWPQSKGECAVSKVLQLHEKVGRSSTAWEDVHGLASPRENDDVAVWSGKEWAQLMQQLSARMGKELGLQR